MPSFKFTSPEGKSYTVNGPDGSTAEQAFGILQQQLGQPGSSAPTPPSGAPPDVPGLYDLPPAEGQGIDWNAPAPALAGSVLDETPKTPPTFLQESAYARQSQDKAAQIRADRLTSATVSASPPGPPQADAESITQGLQVALAGSALKTVLGLQMAYADATGDTEKANELKDQLKSADQTIAQYTPQFDSKGAGMAYEGASGLLNAAPMVAAGSVNPLVGLGLFAGQSGAESYGRYRAMGLDPTQAAVGGGLSAGIMAATSYLPLSFIADKIGKAGVGEFVQGLVARDVPTMVAQGVANDLLDTSLDPNKTLGDFAAEQPQHIAQSVVSAAVFAAGLGVGHAGVKQAAAIGLRFDPSSAFGDAFGADVNDAKFAPIGPNDLATLNPNLTSNAPVSVAGADLGARARKLAASPIAHPNDGVSGILGARSIDEAIDAAVAAAGGSRTIAPIPLPDVTEQIPTGEALELEPIPVGEATEQIPVGEASPVPKPIPVGAATELEPETVEPQALPAPEAGLTPRTPKPPAPAAPMTTDDLVNAYVDMRRTDGTPAGALFAHQFDTGRITPDDVLDVIGKPPPSVDERLAAAAAQGQRAQTEQPGLILRSDGTPFATQLAAKVQARRTGGTAIAVEGGYAVRPKETQSVQPDVAVPAGLPPRYGSEPAPDAVGSGIPVGRVASDTGRPVEETADTTSPGSSDVAPAGSGSEPDQALNAAAPAETAPAQARVPDAAAPPKVYKFRGSAIKAKAELGNSHRIQKVQGGYILRPASDAELAAAQRNGRRLASGGGVDVENDSLLTAISKLGGINMKERPDTIGTGNRNIGGKMLFRLGGHSIDTLANELLHDRGYIPSDEYEKDGGTTWLRDAIRSEYDGHNTYHSEQGTEWMEERQRQYEDAQGPSSEDALADFSVDELERDGYTDASPEVQALTDQLVTEAESLGIDSEGIRDDVARSTEGESVDVYHSAVWQALGDAIRKAKADAAERDAGTASASVGDHGETAGPEGEEAGADQGLTLSAQTPEDIKAKTEQEQAALQAERTSKSAEQARLAKEALQREINDRERQDASAEHFQLGQDAGDALAGQRALFSRTAVPSRAETAAAKAALARIQSEGGVTSPDVLRDLIRVPGYSQWARTALAGNLDATNALRSELAGRFPDGDWKRPAPNSRGIVTVSADVARHWTDKDLADLAAIADRYDVPVAIRGQLANSVSELKPIDQRLRAAGFETYGGQQEMEGRSRGVAFSYLRPGGGIHQNTPIFRRSEPQKGRIERAQTVADAVTDLWANKPPVKVIWDMREAPPEVQAEADRQDASGGQGTPAGFFHDGTVYVVASAAGGDAGVARTLFHEGLVHYGLRQAFPGALDGMLDRFATLNADKIQAKAIQYGYAKTDAQGNFAGYHSEAARRASAEEYLAELGETRPSSPWVKRAIAAIRTWLREKLPGLFGDMHLTDDEIIRNFLVPARNAVERGSATDGVGGSMRFSRQSTEPFYSALARNVEGASMNAAPASGWKGVIKNWISSGKVKADEVEWTGLNDWLDMQQGKVTKAQVADYLKANGVQVRETVLSEPGLKASDLDWTEIRNVDLGDGFTYGEEATFESRDGFRQKVGIYQGDGGYWWAYYDGREIAEDVTEDQARQAAFDAARNDIAEDADNVATKYANYQLPGGTNYREVLLTLPSKNTDELDARIRELSNWPRDPKTAKRADDQPELDRLGREWDSIDSKPKYKSNHWDQPNVLAHIRLNDRTDADGKRVLFVEELQSDWQQAARKHGVQQDLTMLKRRAQEAEDSFSAWQKSNPTASAAIWREQNPDLVRAGQELNQAEADNGKAVPPAPFIGSTEAWLRLALKRIIKMAVDEGYDRVAFINGEQSAERFSLDKDLDSIIYTDNGDGTFGVTVEAKGASYPEVLGTRMTPDQIEAQIGKESAEKMAAGSGEELRGGAPNTRTLTGKDLKVKAAGMRAFYDKIVPSVAKDVLRKVGGWSLGQVRIPLEVKDYDRTTEYVGPDRTIADVKRLYELSRQRGPSIYDNPITGRREPFPINRVSVEGDLRKLYSRLDDGMPFDAAIVHADISEHTASLFGGRLEHRVQQDDISKQTGFDITPAMREKADGGLALFSRAQAPTAGTVAGQPAAPGRKATGYDLYDDLVREKWKSGTTVADSIVKALQPAARDGAQVTAGIIRGNLGVQARERELAAQKLTEFGKVFNRMSKEENYAFIDDMENGRPIADPVLQNAAVALRQVLDERRAEVQALGKGQLENFIENYLPHIWQKPGLFKSLVGRRPFEGNKSFLKQRKYETFKAGLDAGLEPVTTNPVELAMLKAREMDRYIYAQKIFQQMKEAGVAKFVAADTAHPEDWVEINDPIARVKQWSEAEKGLIDRGRYYAPERAATIINNHLSPGLQGIAAVDMIRKAGNAMNAAQLGLSAFHLGFTTLDAAVSKSALGVKQVSRGEILRGVGNIALGSTPFVNLFVTAPLNLIRGDKLLKAYMGDLTDPSMGPIVEALQQAGGRVKMDDIYRNATINEWRQAVKKGNYASAALKTLPVALEMLSKPIFEYIVPRQKLGVFADMAADALDRNPDMDLETKRHVMGKLWDSVDNRMGQLVYDNVFWNRALKDALMVSTRSVGWNLGTIREIGGGIKDVKDIGKIGGLSDRTAYVFALSFTTAILGSTLQYLMTGEGPKELKDVFFPRTGKIRPDGTEDRISLPSYMKDIYEYGHDLRNFVKYRDNPFNTVMNKVHPLIGTLGDIISNKDFFGGAITSPGDSTPQQALDYARFLMKQFTPFSITNYLQQAKTAEKPPTIAGYLSSPSMIGVTPSPGYITKNDAETESAQVNKMHDALMAKFREEMRDGADWGEIHDRALAAGLSSRDLRMIHNSSIQRPPKRLKQFAH